MFIPRVTRYFYYQDIHFASVPYCEHKDLHHSQWIYFNFLCKLNILIQQSIEMEAYPEHTLKTPVSGNVPGICAGQLQQTHLSGDSIFSRHPLFNHFADQCPQLWKKSSRTSLPRPVPLPRLTLTLIPCSQYKHPMQNFLSSSCEMDS